MRKLSIALVGCLAAAAGAVAQQPPAQSQGQGTGRGTAAPLPTLVVEVQAMFNSLKANITRAAEQFPEDKYEWSPTPEVRTWGGLISHISDDNNGACFLLAGETARPAMLDAGGKPTDAGKGLKKADIVRLLGESFARCDKAFAAVTPDTMAERNGTTNRSRIGALIYDTQHISEHYGNIVTYMRLQNMVPPSTTGRGQGAAPGVSPSATPTAPLFTPPANTAPPSANVDGDFTISPPYAPAPELTAKEGVPKGTVREFLMDSKDSKIYPGIARNQPGVVVPYTRRVAVYVPARYVAGTPAPFLVAQDGTSGTYLNNLPPILDNMIFEGRVPAMVVVFVNNGGGDAQGSERGLEYDTVSGLYTEFIETEVLPRVTKEYGVIFTKDPEGRATMGGSSGAACAFTMAWFHPELYRRVLSYSGTFVNQQSPLNPETPHGAWEYHENLIPKSPVKPIRVWLEVGERDNRATSDEASLHNWPLANERMAKVLKAKGYHYQYVFAKDAGHVDRAVVTQTLPLALEWLWNGYQSAGK